MTTVKEFVKETLEQITGAVKEFDEGATDGTSANPFVGITPAEGVQVGILSDCGQPTIVVKFDLAVTVAEAGRLEAGAKIKIASIVDIGGKGSEEATTETVSRVQFSLPVRLGDTSEHQKNRS